MEGMPAALFQWEALAANEFVGCRVSGGTPLAHFALFVACARLP
jgi:hypothetical protein